MQSTLNFGWSKGIQTSKTESISDPKQLKGYKGFTNNRRKIETGRKEFKRLLSFFTPEQFSQRVHLTMRPTMEPFYITEIPNPQKAIHWFIDGCGTMPSTVQNSCVVYQEGYPGVFQDGNRNLFAISDHHDYHSLAGHNDVFTSNSSLEMLSDRTYQRRIAQTKYRRLAVPSSMYQVYLTQTMARADPDLPMTPLFDRLNRFDTAKKLIQEPVYVYLNDVDYDCVFSYIAIKYPHFLISKVFREIITTANILDISGGGFMRGDIGFNPKAHAVIQYIMAVWRNHFKMHNTTKNLNALEKYGMVLDAEK